MKSEWCSLIESGVLKRKSLELSVLRLFNGRKLGEGDLFESQDLLPLDGITIDLFGNAVLITLHRDGFDIESIIEICQEFYNVSEFYVQKRYERKNFTPELILGKEKGPFDLKESALKFKIDFTRGLNNGFFIDSRPVRKILQSEDLSGKRVLNLFSYTCTMGIAAMKGGALSVSNIDSSGSVLNRGKINYELNGIIPNDRDFIKSDVIKKLKFWSKRSITPFDLIILDPPPWFPGKGSDFSVYPQLVNWSVNLLSPLGEVIAFCRDSRVSYDEFSSLFCGSGKRILPGSDYSPFPEEKNNPLKIYRGTLSPK